MWLKSSDGLSKFIHCEFYFSVHFISHIVAPALFPNTDWLLLSPPAPVPPLTASLSHPCAQPLISVAQAAGRRTHITRVVYLFLTRSRDWRLQLSSRCNPWQPERDSNNGGEVEASHTGRKTFVISTRRSCFCVCAVSVTCSLLLPVD